MALTALTTEQKRKMRDYIPELSDRPPGFDLAAWIDNLLSELQGADFGIVSGKGTIAGSDTTVAIAVGADYDGKPVVASVMGNTGASTSAVQKAVWDGSGNLTITLSVAPGGTDTVTVSYIVDARG